ncbi:MAG: FAD-linked oxidase C-terminal domain-containing protein [Dehalococcoidia bacterium]|nr:FAD-linked oxidase C-terminal domain-containing protein [Dehalococcoidia bacterium]
MTKRSKYGRLTSDLISQLKRIAGDGNVLTDERLEDYSHDETLGIERFKPEAVVLPETTEAVSAVLKLANEHCIPVTPRGGGTGISAGAIPSYGGIVLSLEKMDRIIEVDADNFVVVAEAGVPVSELYKAVEAKGLYYPIHPGILSSTIGGNIATNAGGMKAVSTGVTRHFVLGLEAVLTSGEVIQCGGKYVKCSTGYDFTQLLTGSEGTLAVITKVIIRLTLPPGKTEILYIPFSNLKDAINCVPVILKQGILPAGLEFWEQDIVKPVEQFTGREMPLNKHAAYLMLILEEPDEGRLNRLARRISDICLQNNAVDVYVPGSERARKQLIQARESFYLALEREGIAAIADIVVPRSFIADFVGQVHRVAERHSLKIITCGHAGDGNVHLWFADKDSPAIRQRVKKALVEIYGIGVEMGGTISGEHGIGLAKKEYLGIAVEKSRLDLMRRVKRAFDPNNILNPDKVF